MSERNDSLLRLAQDTRAPGPERLAALAKLDAAGVLQPKEQKTVVKKIMVRETAATELVRRIVEKNAILEVQIGKVRNDLDALTVVGAALSLLTVFFSVIGWGWISAMCAMAFGGFCLAARP